MSQVNRRWKSCWGPSWLTTCLQREPVTPVSRDEGRGEDEEEETEREAEDGGDAGRRGWFLGWGDTSSLVVRRMRAVRRPTGISATEDDHEQAKLLVILVCLSADSGTSLFEPYEDWAEESSRMITVLLRGCVILS